MKLSSQGTGRNRCARQWIQVVHSARPQERILVNASVRAHQEVSSLQHSVGQILFQENTICIATVPEVFQQVISRILEGIPNAVNSMDDILVCAETSEQLNKSTNKVMDALKEAGAKLNKDKCVFGKPAVKFLGHEITAEELKIDQEKVTAIDQIDEPNNKTELQRLL